MQFSTSVQMYLPLTEHSLLVILAMCVSRVKWPRLKHAGAWQRLETDSLIFSIFLLFSSVSQALKASSRCTSWGMFLGFWSLDPLAALVVARVNRGIIWQCFSCGWGRAQDNQVPSWLFFAGGILGLGPRAGRPVAMPNRDLFAMVGVRVSHKLAILIEISFNTVFFISRGPGHYFRSILIFFLKMSWKLSFTTCFLKKFSSYF